jgi:ribosome-binding factor A
MGRRLDRVNELLKREISAVIMRDFVFPNRLVTVNSVEVAQDLKEARVFVGILGGPGDGIIADLNQRHGFIQSKVMKRVVLKNTPVLSFRGDTSVERGVDIVNLLDEVEKIPKAPLEDAEEEE